MAISRRGFLAATGAGAATAAVPLLGAASASAAPASAGGASAAALPDLTRRVLNLFRPLPGHVVVEILAPGTQTAPPISITSNNTDRVFIGSAFKSFVLAEALRQSDAATVIDRQLTLDESVWSPDAPTFNPPHLSGQVSERTALEAMILHSDNTATDMMLRQVGPNRVRAFIASIGLTNTAIPDSTRSFIGYLYGAPNWRTFSWADYVAADASKAPIVNSPLNPVTTMASTAHELVTYYSRALTGAYHSDPVTRALFLETLSIGNAIWSLPVPLGGSAFSKGGSIDVPGFHAVCAPGGVYLDGRWIFYAMAINWRAADEYDTTTAAQFRYAGSTALQLVMEAVSG